MKRIGLIGGMSWESSIEYERIINEEVRTRLGGTHSADLIIRSFDFAVIEDLQASGDWQRAGELLAGAARDLEHCGAEILVLCTNTMHRLAADITDAVSVPLLHIADATAADIHRCGVRTVGLLGTKYTMEAEFYAGRLASQHGLDVRIPNETARNEVHRIIYDELVQGVIDDDSRQTYIDIASELIDGGVEGIIAGCTEIELLLRSDDLNVPYFPTTRLHATAAVDLALASQL
ncbi:MAG: aspartate/glutamate racemase family protein [Ilumatobacteraceae bacterium]